MECKFCKCKINKRDLEIEKVTIARTNGEVIKGKGFNISFCNEKTYEPNSPFEIYEVLEISCPNCNNILYKERADVFDDKMFIKKMKAGE